MSRKEVILDYVMGTIGVFTIFTVLSVLADWVY